jgi:hypothetical protein
MKRVDILWKGIIRDLFDDFIRFFYPDADAQFDLSKGFHFLDKELEQLSPGDDLLASKYIDDLIRIYIRSGPEDYSLLHVEVQDQKVAGFEERMYTYYYRIQDRFRHPVATLVILTGTNNRFRPASHKVHFQDTSLNFGFRTYRVADQQEEALLNHNNPFAIVILTVQLAQKIKKLREPKSKNQQLTDYRNNDQILYDSKLKLAENLLNRKLSPMKLKKLLSFLKHYVPFENSEFTNKFDNKILSLTNKTVNMTLEECILDLAEKQGLENGEKKGIQKGVQLGKRTGRKEAKSEVAKSLLLKTDFSPAKIAEIVGVRTAVVQKLKEAAACA